MSSGISFEWTQRNAERTNKLIEMMLDIDDYHSAVAVTGFLIGMGLSEQEFAFLTYGQPDEQALKDSVDFLKRAGINLGD